MSANFVCFEEEGAEFAWIKRTQSFAVAKKTCSDLNATLSRISNRPTLDFLEKNIFLDTTDSTKTWIGLQFNPSAGHAASDATSKKFAYVDGFPNISFFETDKQSPWGSKEPDGSNGPSNSESCVDYRPPSFLPTQRPWGDFSCDNANFVLCRRNCFTNAPTFSPSADPTISPTNTPTNSPTKNPTEFVSEVTTAPSSFLNDRGDGTIDGVVLTGSGLTVLSLFAVFSFLIIFFSMVYLRDKNNLKVLRQKLKEIYGDSREDPTGNLQDSFSSELYNRMETNELHRRVDFEPISAQQLQPNVPNPVFLKHFPTKQTPILTKPPPKDFPESINGDDASTLAFLRTSAGDGQSFYLESLLGPPSVILPLKAKTTTQVGNKSGLLSKEEIDALRLDQVPNRSTNAPELNRVNTEELERDI